MLHRLSHPRASGVLSYAPLVVTVAARRLCASGYRAVQPLPPLVICGVMVVAMVPAMLGW